jgi:hypothetical protein
MHGVEFPDKMASIIGSRLSFDLKDVLAVLGGAVWESQWRVSRLWCMGERTEEFEAYAEQGQLLSGDLLVELASGVFQVIDGDFEAFRSNAEKPWLIIRAIDSHWFEG